MVGQFQESQQGDNMIFEYGAAPDTDLRPSAAEDMHAVGFAYPFTAGV